MDVCCNRNLVTRNTPSPHAPFAPAPSQPLYHHLDRSGQTSLIPQQLARSFPLRSNHRLQTERLVPPPLPDHSQLPGTFIFSTVLSLRNKLPPHYLQLRFSLSCRNTAVTNISGSAALRQTVRKTFHCMDGLSVAWHFGLFRHETQFFFFLWSSCVSS